MIEAAVVSDPYIEQMLEAPRRVMVYEPEDAALARDIFDNVVLEMAAEIQVSNPALDNLVILDSHTEDEHWAELLPGVEVASLSDLESGECVLSRSMCIAAFGNGFLQRKILTPFVGATRFYAAVQSSLRTATQVQRVHPLDQAVFLEGAMA